jgi:glutathione peroxidase
MSIYDFTAETLDGQPAPLADWRDKVVLVVNTASKCGFTPQFAGLEQLASDYKDRGLVVVGFPCNQFGHQDPGANSEIESFCQLNYGVSFPMMEKVDVNGDDRHPLYAELTAIEDAEGNAGDVVWNFEKFLISPSGAVTRFRPMVAPEDEALVAAVEAALPN